MKLTTIKCAGLLLGTFLVSTSGVHAEENQGESNINKDQVNGRVEESKGAAKEITGKILDDKSMEIEGNIQKNLGKAQAGYGDLKKNIKDDINKDN